MAENCLICERLASAQAGQNPYLIAEFEHSVFVVGDHQYYRGYTLLLLKQHIRDLHELAPDIQAGMFRELMEATNAVVKTFAPDKLNHACLGNSVAHNHWHIFPRYAADPYFMQPPFLHADQFQYHMLDAAAARPIAAAIRANLV